MLRYLLKIKSSTKLPDFIQIRDEQFVLLGYVRLDRELKDLHNHGLTGYEKAFRTFVDRIPFGKIEKFEVNER